ncbi:MAG TPA: response regulator [Pyrinomonadaceae bacterium]|jgi:DNA-binding NtrC family response regulator|nr:response regulator [Pyrinomonadaceae bacterium]
MPRVLIVEDEPVVRAVLCEILAASYECVAVGSAEGGLKLLSETAFDAAITDVKLPGLSGEEFLLRAHELNPSLPVVVVTGADSDEAKFLDEGAFGYLLKPFRFEEVEELVRRPLVG